jgi:hypothetical protein
MHYNQHELQLGTKIEMEHTKDVRLAQKISMDHLRENPVYYTQLMNAGLAEEGAMTSAENGMTQECDVAVVKIQSEPVGGEAQPAKPLTSSNLASGTPKPLTSDTLQAPSGNNKVNTGKTPPKLGGKDSLLGDLNVGSGKEVEDEEGNEKPNNVHFDGTPPMTGNELSNCDSDPVNYFAGQISKALKDEVPRRMEMMPANIYEGGAQLKKKVNNYGGVKVNDAQAGITTDMKADRRWTISSFDTNKANKKETPTLKELCGLVEKGNVPLTELIFQTDSGQANAGVMEVFEFFEKATNDEKTQFDNLVNSGQEQAAWNLLQKVLNVRLKGEGPWNPGAT